MKRWKKCRRCGKRWCGRPRFSDYYGEIVTTFGSKKCRDKGSKR